MALIRCGSGASDFAKYVSSTGAGNSGLVTAVYDNGSGEQIVSQGTQDTPINASDLVTLRYVSGAHTITFKADCNVVYGSGSTTFYGVKHNGDVLNAGAGATYTLFAWA